MRAAAMRMIGAEVERVRRAAYAAARWRLRKTRSKIRMLPDSGLDHPCRPVGALKYGASSSHSTNPGHQVHRVHLDLEASQQPGEGFGGTSPTDAVGTAEIGTETAELADEIVAARVEGSTLANRHEVILQV
jgi:hypothetical protein